MHKRSFKEEKGGGQCPVHTLILIKKKAAAAKVYKRQKNLNEALLRATHEQNVVLITRESAKSTSYSLSKRRTKDGGGGGGGDGKEPSSITIYSWLFKLLKKRCRYTQRLYRTWHLANMKNKEVRLQSNYNEEVRVRAHTHTRRWRLEICIVKMRNFCIFFCELTTHITAHELWMKRAAPNISNLTLQPFRRFHNITHAVI